jgi:hypothetical protein
MDCKFECPQRSSKKRAIVETKSPLLERYEHPTSANTSINNVKLLNVQTLDRRAVPESYSDKGLRYYNLWKDRTDAVEDEIYPCTFDQDFTVVGSITTTSPVLAIREVLQAEGYAGARNYLAITLSAPPEFPIADFSNTISSIEGVFLANANDRGERPVGPNLPNGQAPIQWQFSMSPG